VTSEGDGKREERAFSVEGRTRLAGEESEGGLRTVQPIRAYEHEPSLYVARVSKLLAAVSLQPPN
jgi:hypothetical protein